MKNARVARGPLVAALILIATSAIAAGQGPQLKPGQPLRLVAAAGGVCRADAPQFDARSLGVVPAIRDQVGCGSCWAFGTAAAYEISYGIMNPDVRPAGIDVSEQHIMSCSIGTCAGGMLETALRWMGDHRIAREAELTYQEVDFSCPFQNAATDYVTTEWGHVDKANPLYPSRNEIKAAVCNHGAVVTAMKTTDNFKNDGAGTVAERASTAREKTNLPTNHVVAIIGWDDSRHAWLIRNSWGNWGERGYRFVDYDSHNIGYDAAWIDARPKRAKKVEVRNLIGKGSFNVDLDVSYDVSGFRHATDNNFPVGQSRTRLVPEHARNVTVTARAVGGRHVFTKNYPMPEDACFEIWGTTLNPEYSACYDKPYVKPNETKDVVVNNIIGKGSYVARMTVTFTWNGQGYREQRNIAVGQSGKVEVPVEATSLVLKAEAVAGKDIFTLPFPKAQDLCYDVWGTTLDPKYSLCALTQGCYRHVEIKNRVGGGYAAEATVSYSLGGQRQPAIQSGSFAIGQIKRMPVPCDATEVTVTAKAIAGRTIFTKTDPRAADRCYEVWGTTLSPHYQACGIQTDCKRRIRIHNSAAYAAEFDVSFDYQGERQTLRSGSFPVGREKEINVPCDATNVRVHAKAIGGRDILTKTYTRAEDVCYTVRGTTLNPRYEGCR